MSGRLFLGGCMDGKVMDVPETARLHRAYIQPPVSSFWQPPSDPYEAMTFVTESYTLRRFMCGGNEHEVFVLDGVTNPIEMLIKGYRKRPSRKKRRP